MNQRWTRWIFASCADYIQASCNTFGLDLFVEGEERATETKNNWCELRIDGPDYTEISRGYYKVGFEVNVLLSVVMNNEDPVYNIQAFEGQILSIMSMIPLYKYGPSSDANNDNTQFGCAVLDPDVKDPLVTNQLGKRRPDTRLLQSTIEGHYTLYLED